MLPADKLPMPGRAARVTGVRVPHRWSPIRKAAGHVRVAACPLFVTRASISTLVRSIRILAHVFVDGGAHAIPA